LILEHPYAGVADFDDIFEFLFLSFTIDKSI